MKKLLTLTLLALGAVGFVQADSIRFTITGTADSTLLGYTAGESYSFSWEINEAYGGNPNDTFSPGAANQWMEKGSTDDILFSTIFGDGITGSHTPSDTSESYILCMSGGADVVTFSTLAESNDYIDLLANGNQVKEISAAFLFGGTYPGSYVDPTSYFSDYTGSYGAVPSVVSIYDDSGKVEFSGGDLTVEAIPEPSVLALASIFGGGLLAVRRFLSI